MVNTSQVDMLSNVSFKSMENPLKVHGMNCKPPFATLRINNVGNMRLLVSTIHGVTDSPYQCSADSTTPRVIDTGKFPENIQETPLPIAYQQYAELVTLSINDSRGQWLPVLLIVGGWILYYENLREFKGKL